jgi:peroxiredoxin Q/BCP
MRLPIVNRAAIHAVSVGMALAATVAGYAVAGDDDKRPAPPAVGEEARDFELAGLDGNKVKLSSVIEGGPVVLVVLRGYPGYQCPLCTAQVAQFVNRADRLQAAGAKVVLVYPGPADKLKRHAEEFVGDRGLPKPFRLLIDPDYSFTKAYALRWDAPHETAFPATFVIDKDRKIIFAKISKTHGDRAAVEDVLKALPSK